MLIKIALDTCCFCIKRSKQCSAKKLMARKSIVLASKKKTEKEGRTGINPIPGKLIKKHWN
jgi:hypothetical protein